MNTTAHCDSFCTPDESFARHEEAYKKTSVEEVACNGKKSLRKKSQSLTGVREVTETEEGSPLSVAAKGRETRSGTKKSTHNDECDVDAVMESSPVKFSKTCEESENFNWHSKKESEVKSAPADPSFSDNRALERLLLSRFWCRNILHLFKYSTFWLYISFEFNPKCFPSTLPVFWCHEVELRFEFGKHLAPFSVWIYRMNKLWMKLVVTIMWMIYPQMMKRMMRKIHASQSLFGLKVNFVSCF